MQAEILHLPEWARTSLGTPIELFRKGHTGSSPLIFIGGVHGDEPEGVRLAQEFLAWLRTPEAASDKSRPWILIPNINPDGVAKRERVNARGVDLNRNFPSPDWTPEIRAPRYNPGPSPASEPEVRALCDLFAAEKPQVIVHFHSWKPCVVYTGAGGRPWSDAFAEGTGYESREDIGYPTPGSLGQYAAYSLNTPCVCIEAEDGAPLDTIWPKFKFGLQNVMTGRRP